MSGSIFLKKVAPCFAALVLAAGLLTVSAWGLPSADKAKGSRGGTLTVVYGKSSSEADAWTTTGLAKIISSAEETNIVIELKVASRKVV